MNIKDIKNLRKRVKLTEKFLLEESFDSGTILQIDKILLEDDYKGEESYKVYVTALASDFKHNKSVAEEEWFDLNNGPSVDIFEHEKQVNKGFEPKEDWKCNIFVMGDEEAFEAVDDIDEDEKLLDEIMSVIDTYVDNYNQFTLETEIGKVIKSNK
jgi:hypothetical protein